MNDLVYFTNGKEGQKYPPEGANLCFNIKNRILRIQTTKRYWKYVALPIQYDGNNYSAGGSWIEINKEEFLKIIKDKEVFKLI